MNNLSLLFDYKGTISAQQFKRGVYIVSAICGLMIILDLFKNLDYYTLPHHQWSIEQFLIETLFRSFTPSFIYIGFIIFYCSLTLSIKRGRSLGLASFIRNIYGILIYLFFKTITITIAFSFHFINTFRQRGNTIGKPEFSNETNLTLCIIATIIACITIVGYFIIVGLSKVKESDTENNFPPTSSIDYTTILSLLALMLLTEIIYYSLTVFLSSNLSPVAQTLLAELQNLIIYILATWLIFRTIVPNNKDENIRLSIFENQIIRILFYWKGSISKREFWCGIVIIWTSSLYILDKNVWQTIDNFVVSNTYEGYGFIESTTLLSLLQQFVPSFFPYGCVIFYSSILVAIKRCRALHYNTSWGFALGVFTYLSIASIYTIINLSKETVVNNNLCKIILSGCALLFIIGFLIIIMGIIVLSRNSALDSNPSSTHNNSMQYIISNGWLLLFWVSATLVISQFQNLLGHDFYLTALIMTYIIYFTAFIFLSINRLQNTNLSNSWVIIGIAIFLMSEIAYYTLHECKFFVDSPSSYAFGQFITSIVTSSIIASSFLLFFIPSKSKIT